MFSSRLDAFEFGYLLSSEPIIDVVLSDNTFLCVLFQDSLFTDLRIKKIFVIKDSPFLFMSPALVVSLLQAILASLCQSLQLAVHPLGSIFGGGCFSALAAAALAAVALGGAVALGAGAGERGSALAPFAGDTLGLAAPFAGDLLGLCCGLAAGFFNVETTAILVLLEITACLSSQWLPQKQV